MSYRGTGRATVDESHPSSFKVCDRCGAWRNRQDLVWQYDYRGNALTNLRILVCQEQERCNDAPFEFYRPILVGPDPVAIQDPRPEWFAYSENPNNPPVTINQLVDDDEGSS